jgi:hypothetical protein
MNFTTFGKGIEFKTYRSWKNFVFGVSYVSAPDAANQTHSYLVFLFAFWTLTIHWK